MRAKVQNLGVYFHTFKVNDHNNDITNTAISTVDLQNLGHSKFQISVSFRAIKLIAMSFLHYLGQGFYQ